MTEQITEIEEKKKVEERIEEKTKNLEEKSKQHETKQEEKKKSIKKFEAIARGVSLPISKKHSMYICQFIKNKSINKAINDLEKVIKFKEIVPFKGEIPHRKGMMSGRYPINASKYFIKLLKGLKGNIIANGLDLEKTKLYIGSASWSARPMKTGGRRAKRTNVILRAKEFSGGKEWRTQNWK